MIAILQGGHESEAEISRVTSKAFQEALLQMNKAFKVLECDESLVASLQELKPKLCLLALHGTHGEDGSIQGLLEHLKMPYTGSGVFSSSLSFDKVASKNWAKHLGVPVLEDLVASSYSELSKEGKKKIASWKEGFVVKPSKSGSSRGVVLCDELSELESAFLEARRWSADVLIERRLKAREVTVSLLNGEAFEPIEIRPKSGFYDMKNKYTAGATEYLNPADLPLETIEKLKSFSLKIFKGFRIRTYCRVDFLVSTPGTEVQFMEVNTLPGCTPTSLLPKALAYKGVSFQSLVQSLLDGAALES